MSNFVEQRMAVRLPFVQRVVCLVKTKGSEAADYDGQVRDLSIRSLYVRSKESPMEGTTCSVSLTLQGKHSVLDIRDIKGKIERVGEKGFVVFFSHHLEWFAIMPMFFQQHNKVKVV